MFTYSLVILLCWIAFLLVWGIGTLNVKPDITGTRFESFARYWLMRLRIGVLLVVVFLAFVSGRAPTFLARRVFAPPEMVGWIAAVLVVLGVAIAIWARVYLGRNWSSRPEVKAGHELVTTGPYAYVRHPIYAGMLLAGLGSALTGNILGIGPFILICLIFGPRIRQEEEIMLEFFPNEYPAYQARTKRLVPGVW